MDRFRISGKRAEFVSRSREETIDIGYQFAKTLLPNSVVSFQGDLGAGKTTFIKGVAAELSKVSPDSINSPTFVYLNIYEGPLTIYHFDLYRLKGVDEFLSMGFDEVFHAKGVTLIEWSERIELILPPHLIRVQMTLKSENERHIQIYPNKLKSWHLGLSENSRG